MASLEDDHEEFKRVVLEVCLGDMNNGLATLKTEDHFSFNEMYHDMEKFVQQYPDPESREHCLEDLRNTISRHNDFFRKMGVQRNDLEPYDSREPWKQDPNKWSRG